MLSNNIFLKQCQSAAEYLNQILLKHVKHVQFKSEVARNLTRDGAYVEVKSETLMKDTKNMDDTFEAIDYLVQTKMICQIVNLSCGMNFRIRMT